MKSADKKEVTIMKDYKNILKGVFFVIMFAWSQALAQTNADYNSAPPFIATAIQPNVLIVLDNSGSMCDQAYTGSYDTSGFANGYYYGYFDGSKNYKYSNNNRWEETTEAITNGTTANPIASGSFLNWATMRRVEVAKKLLIGGKGNPRSWNGSVSVKLDGETGCGSSWDFQKDHTTTAALIYPFVGDYRFSRNGSDDLSVSPISGGSNTFYTYPFSDISLPAGWSEYPAAGAVTAWDKVDESSSDSDTTYIQNSNTTSPVILGYSYTQAEPAGTITVTVQVRAKKTLSGGTRDIQGVLRIDGADYEANTQSIGTSYSLYSFAWTSNPVTGAAWTWNEIKAIAGSGNLQGFGVKAAGNYTDRYPRATQVYLDVSVTTPSGGPYNTIVDQGSVDAEGIIDRLGDEARFGLAYYASSYEGGRIAEYVDFGAATNMITNIAGMVPSTWTPLGETLYEMTRYFRQDSPYYSNSPADFQTGLNYDPYYFNYTGSSTDQYVPCAKSFILFLTDGESTQDTSIPGASTSSPYAPCSLTNIKACSGYGGLPNPRFAGTSIGQTYGSNGRDYMIDVAYWARTNDARPGSCTTTPTSWQQCLPGNQNVVLYPLFMFGSGSTLLKDAAIYGGFNDVDGDNQPDCLTNPQECYRDSDGDGTVESNGDDLPLTYYEGDDGYALETSITDAITDILRRSASGTSVSILATSQEGEGALYQAYFYPEKIMDDGSKRDWLGYCRGLFLDSYGNLREDTDSSYPSSSASQVFNIDKIIRMEVNETTGEVSAGLYSDTSPEDGEADLPTPDSSVAMDDIKPIWGSGKNLAMRDKTTRNMYVWIDSDADGVVDNGDFGNPTGEALLFTSGNASNLQPYLRAADSSEAVNIVNFTVGIPVSGYRNRCLPITGASQESGCSGANERSWPLGDIINSTPTVVASPKEQYDVIYGVSSYINFRGMYNNRRNMVYVGGNDGMLHAFNAGVYTGGDDAGTTSVTEHGMFSANPTTDNGWTAPTPTLGDELWAFIPYDNLPHLKWLTSDDYSHVYFTDLKPKITDVRIFCDSDTALDPPVTPNCIVGQYGASHPGGWGTIMIMGLRLGGGAINVDLNGDGDTNDAGEQSFRSAYYALDITDPEKPPRLLWRFTDSGLGFTTNYPSIAHIKSGSSEKWFMVVGSGPDNNAPNGTRGYDGSSTQQGKVFVVNILNGSLAKTFTVDNNAFMGNPTAIDIDLDYSVDVIYIGSVISKTSGKIYRITTGENIDPNTWVLSTMFDQGAPLLAAPTVSRDSLNNLWVFFGTGRFFDTDDKVNSDQQRFYGIKDACWSGSCTTTYTLANLLNTSAVQVSSATGTAAQISGSTSACGGAATCSYAVLIDTARNNYQGWYIDLSNPATPSERVLSSPVLIGGIVLFTAFIPNSDICAFLGDSYVYALYYETGTAYIKSVIGTETISGTEYIKKSASIGKGMPTTVGIAVGRETKGFIQTSTGTIVEIDTETPNPKSGVTGWREKSGGGTVEIEKIYKHIVK